MDSSKDLFVSHTRIYSLSLLWALKALYTIHYYPQCFEFLQIGFPCLLVSQHLENSGCLISISALALTIESSTQIFINMYSKLSSLTTQYFGSWNKLSCKKSHSYQELRKGAYTSLIRTPGKMSSINHQGSAFLLYPTVALDAFPA